MAKLLWKPTQAQIKTTNMCRFMNLINETYNQNFKEYASLYDWSIENISDFWAAFWKFAGVIHSKSYDQVVDDATKMPGAHWFPGAQLNFA
ncbi:MAG: acetyl-coenzyme A synthetase N-terminal domain-containing protein, partial [Desulfobacterales bacterium]